MTHEKERSLFNEHLKRRSLKRSAQREAVLDVFLDVERHITTEELHRLVRRKDPALGLATVYRTLSLLRECGLCREVRFEDGTTRYEHLFGHQHHDHLICTRCGQIVEVVEPVIEQLQEKLFARYGFHPQDHRMDLYGICGKCRT